MLANLLWWGGVAVDQESGSVIVYIGCIRDFAAPHRFLSQIG